LTAFCRCRPVILRLLAGVVTSQPEPDFSSRTCAKRTPSHILPIHHRPPPFTLNPTHLPSTFQLAVHLGNTSIVISHPSSTYVGRRLPFFRPLLCHASARSLAIIAGVVANPAFNPGPRLQSTMNVLLSPQPPVFPRQHENARRSPQRSGEFLPREASVPPIGG
jgi:hypothetical protein